MTFDHEELLRRATRPTVNMLAEMAEGRSAVARKVLEELGQRFCEPGFNMEAIRTSLKISERTMKKVNRELGISARDLLRECRMDTAWRLLRDTSLSVEEIAILLGYNNRKSLERLCEDHCNLTPAEVRSVLRATREDLAKLDPEVFTWFFEERLHEGDLEPDEVAPVTDLVESRYYNT